VVQVNYGGRNKPELESLLPYPLLEVEASPAFSSRLNQLSAGEISYLRLPQRAVAPHGARPPVLDAVWPLPLDAARAYLVYSTSGERFDRLLMLAPRLRGARVGIVENESEESATLRWLFNDDPPLVFSSGRRNDVPIPDAVRSYLADGGGNAVVDGDRYRWLFAEYFPYPDRLVTWVLSQRLDNAQIGGQFRVIGYGLAALTLVMALFSILLASLAARRLARPVTQLARNMRNYAHGVPMGDALRSWSSEVNALESEFKQMINGLEKAREARSRAERKLVKSARLASIGEMAAGIGHELNNPLTNILSLAKLITRSGKPCPGVVDDAEAIIAETRRAAHIVKGILNFARQIEPVYERVEVREWIEVSARRLAGALEKKDIDLQIDADAHLVMDADRYQMEQVLLNLLQNAIHASPPGGVIRLVAEEDAGWLVVRVIDHGSGIDPQIEERLFEPFATSKPVGEGSGLGLSISLGIVEMHGGQLQLDNNEAGGVTAEIRIPMVKT
jgi:two-component system NtrC family sensor kinase